MQQDITTVIIVARNEKVELTLCIDTIRRFAGEEALSLVVIDNMSQDGTAEWLSGQKDIAYATMDEGEKGYGEILNEAIETFGITGDILLMEPGYALTTDCLTRMKEALYSADDIGAVSPLSNGNSFTYGSLALKNYEEALLAADKRKSEKAKMVMSLSAGAVLIAAAARKVAGPFEEQLFFPDICVMDYCLRLNREGFKRLCVMSAVAFCMSQVNIDRYLAAVGKRPGDVEIITKKWGLNYFLTGPNPNLISMLVHDKTEAIQVLEAGCNCGSTLLEIKDQYPAASVYGFELNPEVAEIAGGVADVQVGNLEELSLPYAEGQFDYILFGDVLEHLRNPQEVLRYCRRFLKRQGRIVACIPNLMHVSVIKDLLSGNFTYAKSGLLDRTHIHFFTYQEILKMFAACDYQVEAMQVVMPNISAEEKEFVDRLGEFVPKTERFQFEAFQYLVRATRG